MNEWLIFRIALPLLMLAIVFAVASIARLLGRHRNRHSRTRWNGELGVTQRNQALV